MGKASKEGQGSPRAVKPMMNEGAVGFLKRILLHEVSYLVSVTPWFVMVTRLDD